MIYFGESPKSWEIVCLGPGRQAANKLRCLFEELLGSASILWPFANVTNLGLELLQLVLPIRGYLGRDNVIKHLLQKCCLLFHGTFQGTQPSGDSFKLLMVSGFLSVCLISGPVTTA